MRCARPCGSAAACDVACPDPELRERRRLAAGADAASVMTGAAERSLQVAVVLLYLVQLTAGTGTAGVLEGGSRCDGLTNQQRDTLLILRELNSETVPRLNF